MAKQREGRLQKKIQDTLKLKYGRRLFIFKVWGSDHMMAGLPDLIGCLDGHFFGLEVKLPESRLNTSRRQDYVLSLITRAGGTAAVVCSPEEAMKVLGRVPRRRGSDDD